MYNLCIKNNEYFLVNKAYQAKLLGYDKTTRSFIRKNDCKVHENLVPNLTYLKLIFTTTYIDNVGNQWRFYDTNKLTLHSVQWYCGELEHF